MASVQALVCRRQKDDDPGKGSLHAEALTTEHVPGEPLERMRIEAAGGQVIRAGRLWISAVLEHAIR